MARRMKPVRFLRYTTSFFSSQYSASVAAGLSDRPHTHARTAAGHQRQRLARLEDEVRAVAGRVDHACSVSRADRRWRSRPPNSIRSR